MGEWELYRCLDGDYRWRNTYGDEVRAQDMLFGCEIKVLHEDERYHTRYKPARSEIVTTVPNGRFEDMEDAVEYAEDVVIDAEIKSCGPC